MKLKATITWSTQVEVDVDLNASEWDKKDALHLAAEAQLQELQPVITDCNDSSLEE